MADNVTILGGVTIGDGAVIATGSVVAHDIMPYEMVSGVPAQHVKYIFDIADIKELLKIKWWNWPDKTVREHQADLISKDIKGFIKKYKSKKKKK
ncbi:MAG: antibiotic acetyltransferase [Methanomicrobia archaeon]|nr:antibiotic acetyltransferase [Methanomicrobia archaeon]